jgi:hypothetical protein
MIERAYIQVMGPPGSGKTTLVERLLESYDGWASVARCVRDDSVREAVESSPPGDPELGRYRRSGADGVCRYRYSSTDANSDDFFFTDLMADPSEAVIFEGDRPVPYVDLAVYVAPACPEGGALLVRKVRDRAREARDQATELQEALQTPGGLETVLAQTLGPDMVAVLRAFEGPMEGLREKMTREILEGLERIREAPPPEPTEHWAVAEGYGGIELAQAVVVNVRDAGERERAAGMVEDLKRLRKDPEVFDEVLGVRGNRVPITALAADLSDPRDPGTRKILGRIKRSIRAAL